MTTALAFDTDIGGTGTRLQPGLAHAYPELVPLIQALYRNRVAKLPWLPSNWITAVLAIQADNPDDLVVIARKNWGGEGGQAVWWALADDCSEIIKKYAAKQTADGRILLAQLDRNAAFWNAAYTMAVEVRDALPNALGFVGSNLWEGLGSKWKIIILVAGVGAALYFTYPFLRGLKAVTRK